MKRVSASVRAWLRSADLVTVNMTEAGQALGVPFSTLSKHLSAEGVTWRQLKREEQIRRLAVITATPGRVDISAAAECCGYSYSESFLLFFKNMRGETFTQWRTNRQSEAF